MAGAPTLEDAIADDAIDIDLDNAGATAGAEALARPLFDMGNAVDLGLTPTTNRLIASGVDSSDLMGAEGAFTYEALINLDSVDPADYANDRYIMSAGNDQIHLRIEESGGALRLRFENGSGVDGGESLSVLLPTTGPNALQAGVWFHVAATYDGLANGDGSVANPATTFGELNLYWTRLDASTGVANAIGSETQMVDTPTFGPRDLVFGNRRLAGATNNLPGRIDEVRISGVARMRDEFVLASTAGMSGQTQPLAQLTILDDDRTNYSFTLDEFRTAEGDVPNISNVVTVTRSGDTTIASSVEVRLVPGTATENVDYTAATVTVDFAPGEVVKSVPIEILGETLIERDETVGLVFEIVVASATSIRPAAADVDAGGSWRSTSDPKVSDANSDNIYGTDGYYIQYSAGSGLQSELPGYVASVDQVPGLRIFEGGQGTNPNYLSLDLAGDTPDVTVADQVTGLLNTQPGAGVSDWLEFTLAADMEFRLGVVIDNSDRADISPMNLTLSQIAGGAASATQLTLWGMRVTHSVSRD